MNHPVPLIEDPGARALETLRAQGLRDRAAVLERLLELEDGYLAAKAFILKVHPNEKIEDFGPLVPDDVPVDDVELLHETEMAVLILERTPLVERIETRANELHAESERARAGAERARVVNQTDVERLFGIVRDQSAQINHLTTRVAKLEGGASTVRPSPAPYAPRSNAPQLLGQPAGMGSHSGHRFGSSNSGVRRLVSAAAPVPIKG